MADSPMFSIIVAFREPGIRIEECLRHIFESVETSYEVILLPDAPLADPKGLYAHPSVRVAPTGDVGMPRKLDAGAFASEGRYLAFIDDACRPDPYWLVFARQAFEREQNLAAVCGAARVPAGDSFLAKVCAASSYSRFTGGHPQRVLPLPPRGPVSSWPALNLVVSREAYKLTGGVAASGQGCLETGFSKELIAASGGSILYMPELTVTREGEADVCLHLKRSRQAATRLGFAARSNPGGICLCAYLPSLWLLFLIPGLFVLPCSLLSAGIWLYVALLVLGAADTLRHESLAVTLAAMPVTALTHLWKGWGFLRGWFAKELPACCCGR